MATAMSRMDQGMEETLGSPVLPDPIDMSISARCGVVVAKSRRTFESLPGLLPGRRHIVLTRDSGWSAPGAEVVADPQAALRQHLGLH